MKTEQEIVLQKKTIIIFSLLILILAMGILNVQKTTVLAAAKQEKITKVYTTYIANADLFKIEVSGEVVSGDGRIGITTAESGEAIVPNENRTQQS